MESKMPFFTQKYQLNKSSIPDIVAQFDILEDERIRFFA